MGKSKLHTLIAKWKRGGFYTQELRSFFHRHNSKKGLFKDRRNNKKDKIMRSETTKQIEYEMD